MGELSLDFRPIYVPKSIREFLSELSTIVDVSERLSKLDDFVKRLEEEMRKIDAFKRELPLCMLLINDAIMALKEESIQCRRRQLQPVLEEFIPLKKISDVDETDEPKNERDGNKDKKDWLSSAQLWKTDEHKNAIFSSGRRQNSEGQVMKDTELGFHPVVANPFPFGKNKSGSMAFMPLKVHSIFSATAKRKEDKGEQVSGLSLMMPGMKNSEEQSGPKTPGSRSNSSLSPVSQLNLRTGTQPLQQQTSRKQRRCWSPELHRCFVNALQQLGGSQAATPKQIRELMQVDGLTNDEVKSHLQKYRLHTRRAPAATATPSNQSMVVGIPPQYNNGESSKQSSSQYASPQGPFDLSGTGCGNSSTGGNSMEEEEDEKSESYSWKDHSQRSGEDDV